jgi:uncharacterized protein (TIGR02246 family)
MFQAHDRFAARTRSGRAVLAFGLALGLASPGQTLASEPGSNSGGQAEAAAYPVVQQVLGRLDQAWTAMDGARFAAEFTRDADVINVNGSRFVGRADVARQMQFLFDGRFKGSRHASREIELVRELAPGLVLSVSSATILTPAGANPPEVRSRQSFILEKSGDRWLIRHWRNTPIREVREGAPTR